MKELKVIIKDKTTLVLAEDGCKGDEINLTELNEVDLSMIEEVINRGKDQIYEKKLNEYKIRMQEEQNQALRIQKLQLDGEYAKKISELNEIIEKSDLAKQVELQQLKQEYETLVNSKNEKIKVLEETYESKLQVEKLTIEQKYSATIESLKREKEELKPIYELQAQKTINDSIVVD